MIIERLGDGVTQTTEGSKSDPVSGAYDKNSTGTNGGRESVLRRGTPGTPPQSLASEQDSFSPCGI